jgi:hypothetical protein
MAAVATTAAPEAAGTDAGFIPSTLVRRDLARMAAYQRNLDFYHGDQWQTHSRSRQLVFNYARVAVDKVTSYLVAGLGTACYPADPSTGADAEVKAAIDRAEALLQRVREDNGLDALDYETEVDCAILGDGCYKVTWDADARRIRVTAPPVTGLYAWWYGDDPSQLWRVASRYRLPREDLAALHGVSIAQREAYVTELWTSSELALYVDDSLFERKANPYGFIPFVIFPNLKGKPATVSLSPCGCS